MEHLLKNTRVDVNEARLRQLYDPHYVLRVVARERGAVQVCVDSRMLGVQGTGVATYAATLAACLSAAGAVPAVLADAGTPDGATPPSRFKRWMSAVRGGVRWATSEALSPSGLEWPWAQGGWSAADLFREAQVFFNIHGRLLPVVCDMPPTVMHWTYPVPLYIRGARNLYTIHDLIPLQQPALSPIPRQRHMRLLQRIAETADRLVTVSETSRQALIDHLGCAPSFVINTFQAVQTPLQRDPPLPPGLIPGGYFLFCGSVEPRKNVARLIEAHRMSGVSTPLVIAGPDGWRASELNRTLAKAERVVRLPWQPRANLLGLIRQARALCFPSLAEGFGLPVAEAMALGAPVMTSSRGAVCEIAGGAALTVDPLDVAAMARAIWTLDSDDRLRSQLRALGFQRSRMFNMAAYGERLRDLYAAAVDGIEGAGPAEREAQGVRRRG